ncbi:MAG: hypothetical protein IJN44_05835 [Clostridia bacterium]|nr:hypothetical protein [Clostridia bacterium]
MLKRVNHTMKHMILFCSFAFMLFLTPRGIAITEQEWNEGCWDKTSRTIQLYEIRYGDNNEVISLPIGTLESGVYIRSGEIDTVNGWMQLRFCRNGSIQSISEEVCI